MFSKAQRTIIFEGLSTTRKKKEKAFFLGALYIKALH